MFSKSKTNQVKMCLSKSPSLLALAGKHLLRGMAQESFFCYVSYLSLVSCLLNEPPDIWNLAKICRHFLDLNTTLISGDDTASTSVWVSYNSFMKGTKTLSVMSTSPELAASKFIRSCISWSHLSSRSNITLPDNYSYGHNMLPKPTEFKGTGWV